MSRFRHILHPTGLAQGDIIEIAANASPFLRRGQMRGPQGARPTQTYGYVTKQPLYESQNNDALKISVFEIIPLEQALRLDALFVPINHEDTGKNLGLHQQRAWAIIIDPIVIEAIPRNLLRKDKNVQRIGNISGSVAESKITEKIEKRGGEDRLVYGSEDGPQGFQRPSILTYGYGGRGLGRRNFKDDEFVPVEKRKYQRKHDIAGKVIDIDIADAVRILNLPPEIVSIFGTAHGRKNPAITSFRTIWEMADKNPAAMEAYISSTKVLPEGITLAQLAKEDRLPLAIANGLAEPRKGADVSPIFDLKSAFDLVNGPDPEGQMAKYMFMGPKMREWAMADIPALYNEFTIEETKEKKIAALSKTLKAGWGQFTADYLQSIRDNTVPEAYRNQEGAPIWKFVPVKP